MSELASIMVVLFFVLLAVSFPLVIAFGAADKARAKQNVTEIVTYDQNGRDSSRHGRGKQIQH